jgi:hypothetical protein
MTCTFSNLISTIESKVKGFRERLFAPLFRSFHVQFAAQETHLKMLEVSLRFEKKFTLIS